MSFNSLNQLISEKFTSNLSNTTIRDRNYCYDSANNIAKITDNLLKEESIYGYDSDNKLLTITTSSTKQTFQYDNNGNLVNDGAGHLFSYNGKNQLISFQDNKGVQTKYTYYPNGLRKSKQVHDNDPIFFYYDLNTNPNILNEKQGAQTTSYLLTGNQRWMRIWSDGQRQSAQYYCQNSKDVIGLFDQQGNLQTTYAYDSYGEQSTSDKGHMSKAIVDLAANPFQYCGEYLDAESGLVYLRSRFYNPAIKRFMTRDKVPLLNRYNYAESNPIMFTDPSGRCIAFFIEAIVALTEIATEVEATVGAVAETGEVVGEAGAAEAAASAGGASSAAAGGGIISSATPAIAGSAALAAGYAGITSAGAAELFRRSNPGVSEDSIRASEQRHRAVSIAYPEWSDMQPGLRGGAIPNPFNPSGSDVNCVFTTLATAISAQTDNLVTSADIASVAGISERPVSREEIGHIIQRFGGRGHALSPVDISEAANHLPRGNFGNHFLFRLRLNNPYGEFHAVYGYVNESGLQLIDSQQNRYILPEEFGSRYESSVEIWPLSDLSWPMEID